MKILLPLDGSQLAETAVPAAQALAQRWQGEIVLLHTTEPFIPIGLGGQPELSVQVQRQSLDASSSYLAGICQRLKGVKARASAILGYPREEIVRFAEQEACQLIVMSSHGRSGPTRWLLGSVAEAVLRLAPCPVLLVRGKSPAQGEFHRVLVPIDGSQHSTSVLEEVKPFLSAGAKVTLLRATGLTLQDRAQIIDPQAFERYLLGLEEQLHEVDCSGLSVERKVVDGDAADSIVAYASEHNFDGIAMATHGRSGFRRLWLGSVTEKVVRQSPCPVLVLPKSG